MATSSVFPTVEQPSAAAVTTVAQTTSSVTLLAANASRKGAHIQNDATRILFVKYGPGATSTDASVALLPQQLLTLPFPAYTGLLTGTWAGPGTGRARITEMT